MVRSASGPMLGDASRMHERVRRRLSAHCRPRGTGGGLRYKDLRVQGLQQASRVSGEAAERAQYSLCYLL